MATVRLGRYEVEHGSLPRVCMACGAPATVLKSKKFSWHPSWVWVLLLAGLIPMLIVARILTKRMTLAAPFCENHRRYFFLRGEGLGISLLLLFLLGCGGGFGVAELEKQVGGDWAGKFALACVAAFLVWLVFAAVVGERSIHPTEITDTSITLVRVSEEFAKAVHLSRMPPREEDYPEVIPVNPRRPEGGGPGQFYDPKR